MFLLMVGSHIVFVFGFHDRTFEDAKCFLERLLQGSVPRAGLRKVRCSILRCLSLQNNLGAGQLLA